MLKDQKMNTVQQGVSYGEFLGSYVVLLANSHSRRHPSIFFPSADYCVHTVLVNYWQQGSPSCLRANALTRTCLQLAAETSGRAHTTLWQKNTRPVLSDPGPLWRSYSMNVKGELCASCDAYLWHSISSASVNCALVNIYRGINFLLLLPLANDIKLFWHITDIVPTLLHEQPAACKSSASLKGGGEATFLRRAYMDRLTLPFITA